jgi:hypothetical protein
MRALPRHHRSRRTRTALIACGAALTLLLQLLTSSQLESSLPVNSESNLVLDDSDTPMSSGTMHRRYACMGCTARSNGRGEPTFFNDYQSAATHYSRSIHCNKSMRGINSVAVQLDTRLQFVGGGEAGGGGAPGPWRPQPAPARRAGDVISEKQVIS